MRSILREWVIVAITGKHRRRMIGFGGIYIDLLCGRATAPSASCCCTRCSNSGFEAKGLEDGEALFAEMAREKPALILLDVMLPGRERH